MWNGKRLRVTLGFLPGFLSLPCRPLAAAFAAIARIGPATFRHLSTAPPASPAIAAQVRNNATNARHAMRPALKQERINQQAYTAFPVLNRHPLRVRCGHRIRLINQGSEPGYRLVVLAP